MSEFQAGADGITAGALLRQAREAAGLHVATLAANLKVPVSKLEALEEDRYEELPDAVFARALASSVCRTLKVDPAPVLQRLPQSPQPRLAETRDAINAPFRSPNDAPPPGLLNQVSRPVLLTVIALLLGALVLIFLPMMQRGYDAVVQANRSDAPAAPPNTVVETVRPEQPTTAAAAADKSIAGLPAAPASAAGPVPTPAAVTQVPEVPGAGRSANPLAPAQPAAAASSPAAAAPGAPAAPVVAAAADAQGIVAFRARGQSWVQVKDARGTTVMQKLMQAGDSASASGALPLTVTVGSAQSTEVQVRGKPFDLAPVARDNVARFEVK